MSGAERERHWLRVPDAGGEQRLAVVLGNTNCRVALMDGLEIRDELVLRTADLGAEDQPVRLREFAGGGVVREAGLCSVVPRREGDVRALFAAAALPEPRPVRPSSSSFFPTAYRSMDTLGADRYCGVLAAHVLYGAPAMVVDCGTATTVNILDAEGTFLGGMIAPGVETALRALYERTAQLPDTRLSDTPLADTPLPDTPLVGRDTAECMRSGALHFTRLAVEGVARELQNSSGDKTLIILTGGNAPLLAAAMGGGAGVDACVHRVDAKLLFRGVLFHLLLTS